MKNALERNQLNECREENVSGIIVGFRLIYRSHVYVLLFVFGVFAMASQCKVLAAEGAQIGETLNKGRTIILELNEAVEYAIKNDSEIKMATLSLDALRKSRKDIYRTVFPTISTSFSESRIISRGDEDTRNYTATLSLEQVLFNQIKLPARLKSLSLKIEEGTLKLEGARKKLREEVIKLYFDIVFGNRSAEVRSEEAGLYRKLSELIALEYKLGSKTLIDVIEVEKKQLEVLLAEEELIENNRIKYIEILHMTGFFDSPYHLELNHNLDNLYRDVFKDEGISSSADLMEKIRFIILKKDSQKTLYEIGVEEDFFLKKLSYQLNRNRVAMGLLKTSWLKNVSLIYGLNFNGDRFFPSNISHTFGINILFDFLFFSPEVSLNSSALPDSKTFSSEAKSEFLNTIVIPDPKRELEQKAYMMGEKIKDRKREINRQVDIWLVKSKTLLEKDAIYQKQVEIIGKNEELIKLKKQLGAVKPVDYTKFMIERNDFYLEIEGFNLSVIHHIWALESLLNMGFGEIVKLL